MKKETIRTAFARYASMNVLGMLGLSCYILADTWFVARGLGPEGLAALNLAIPVYSVIHGAGLMVGMGGATRYALFRESGARERARTAFSGALLYGAALAALLVLVGVLGSGPLTALLGGAGEVGRMTEIYLRMILVSAPAFLLNNLLLCFVRNDGGPKLAMAAMLAGSFSNVLLDYLFIFPLGMGIFGAVLATCMAPVIGLSVLSFWFLRKRNSFRLCRTGWVWSDVGAVSALGASALVTEVSAGIVMVVFNLLILSLEGEVGVAAYGVIANLSLVTMAVFTGLGQGAQPLVSQCCGRGEQAQARSVRRCALICAVLFSLLVYLMIFCWNGPIAAAFNSTGDGRLQRLAEEGLRLYFIALPFAGVNTVTVCCFSAMDCPRPALTISLLRGLLLILPLAVLFARLWGMAGVWLSFPAAETAAAGTALFLMWKERKA